MDENYDPFNPKFPVQRDFGSNAIEFAGIDVKSMPGRDILTARFAIRSLLFFISDYFGKEEGAYFATSAIKKVLEDFGGAVHDPTALIRAFDRLYSAKKRSRSSVEQLEQMTDGGVVYAPTHKTSVRFEFEMPSKDDPSPLIERMTKLIPYQEMMRELMQPDFNVERIKSILIKIAEDIQSDEMATYIRTGEIEHATALFLNKHFALPE